MVKDHTDPLSATSNVVEDERSFFNELRGGKCDIKYAKVMAVGIVVVCEKFGWWEFEPLTIFFNSYDCKLILY